MGVSWADPVKTVSILDSWGLPGGPRSDGTTKEGRRAGLHFPGVVGCGSAPYASPSMVVGRIVGSWRTCGRSRGDSCCDELHHRRVGSAPLQTSNLPSRNSRPCLWTTVRAVLSVGFGKPEQASPLTQKKIEWRKTAIIINAKGKCLYHSHHLHHYYSVDRRERKRVVIHSN